MNIESLTVVLRPRSAWEAVELGMALTRRHAAAIFKPWLLLSLPLLVAVNLLAWAVDAIWLAGLMMWWLKPVFDRVPVLVLSRAVFGDVPTTAQVLRAPAWHPRWLLPHLTWRRLSPVRSLYLPVDLLEGGLGADARDRRSTLAGPAYGVAALLTLVCVNFEIALLLGAAALVWLFVPATYLLESLHWLTATLAQSPLWMQWALNALAWLATSIVEPFYVGAGFGLYLNRRAQIEAWDIELVLRRLGARLSAARAGAALALVLVVGLGLSPAAHAQEAAQPATSESAPPTLERVFGADRADAAGLQDAVRQAYADPTVSPRRKIVEWQPRDRDSSSELDLDMPPWLRQLGGLFGMVGEAVLWLGLAALLVVLLVTSPTWLRWLRRAAAHPARETAAVKETAKDPVAPLPDDIAGAARRLWREGHPRDALALLYRASVVAMSARAQLVLPPGATEAQCLRASRQLPLAADRDAFARAVRIWQHAAYAGRLPDDAGFDELLTILSQRFGWAA